MMGPLPRPRVPFKPKPKRLPKETAVTIAIGLCGNGGVVLATDSQHTVSGYIKTDRGKIRTTIFHDTLTVVAIAGSGTSDYIETAMDKAIDGIGELDSFPEIVATLETNLLEFFDKHLARWAYFPENDRPTVELLIGLTMKKGPFALFHYSGTSFCRVSQKAIGAGVLLADNLLDDFFTVGSSVEKSSSIAVYVLWKVKQQVDTCGGFTDLVALRTNGDFAFTDSGGIKAMEEELKKNRGRINKSIKKRS